MATLNVTITEELTLNGADRGSTNTLSVASVTQVYHRIVTCPAADASATLLLDAGRSFIMGATHDGIAVDDDDAAIVTSLTDLESILIDPGSNAVSVEIFIAS